MMKLLPFIPEAVIVGNGEFPSHPFPLHILETVSYVICCDGGADAFVHHTDRVPDWIIGMVIRYQKKIAAAFSLLYDIIPTRKQMT